MTNRGTLPSKTMKTKEESNTATIAMMFFNKNTPKGEGKYKKALLSIKKAVHNGGGAAAAPPRYTKQREQRSRKKAVCKRMEQQKKHGYGVAPRYREQQTHPHLKYNKRKNGVNTGQKFSEELLQKSSTSGDNEKKYMYFDWGEGFDIKMPKDAKRINISNFTDVCAKVCATDTKTNITAFDELTDELVFSKICLDQSSHFLGGKKSLNRKRQWIQKAMKKKPDVARGAKRSGCNDAYKIFGIRKEPLGSGVGTYSFKPGVSDDDKDELNNEAQKLCKELELATNKVEKKLIEAETKASFVEGTGYEGMGEGVLATALSIGRNYWSQAHVDKDFYFTRLTVLAPEDLPHKHYHGKVLYYFVFPTYNVRVPLKSGDVLLFNPLILHSCSNPRYKDSYIMSAYVSTRTVLCQASEKINSTTDL